jgi:hypothetical protein
MEHEVTLFSAAFELSVIADARRPGFDAVSRAGFPGPLSRVFVGIPAQ